MVAYFGTLISTCLLSSPTWPACFVLPRDDELRMWLHFFSCVNKFVFLSITGMLFYIAIGMGVGVGREVGLGNG
jgi:hypothetical protein